MRNLFPLFLAAGVAAALSSAAITLSSTSPAYVVGEGAITVDDSAEIGLDAIDVPEDEAAAGPEEGPHSVLWDARDLNSNGDSNAGFTDGDQVGGVGKEWEGSASPAAVQSLQMVTGVSTGVTYVASCRNGKPCVRFNGYSSLLSAPHASGWDTFFVDTLQETCTAIFDIDDTPSNIQSIWGTKLSSTTDSGIHHAYDARAGAGGRHSYIEGTWQTPNQLVINPADDTTPPNTLQSTTIRIDTVNETLDLFANGVEIGSVSIVGRTAVTGADRMAFGRSGGGIAAFTGDLFYLKCWDEEKTDAEILANSAALKGIWTP